ncbi:MAG: hypothetical protein K2J00_03215 [Bacteroidaceae bacterium]|nr:hypothetical protein [Bacteroidaceae bacterium]
MSELNEELFFAEEDRQAVAFIQNYLPQEIKAKFTEDDLYYFLDAFAEYCETSGLVDSEDDDEAEIDIDDAAAFMVRQAEKEHIGMFDAEDVRWVVDGQLEFWETQE